MNESKLDCCIVRDLLPVYLEELTEPETAAQIQAHLQTCPNCRAAETRMRTQISVERTPKHPLRFLKRVGQTRLLAAVLTTLLVLLAMYQLYDREFHYPNTEAGWQAAVEDYVPAEDADAGQMEVSKGTPLRVLGAVEREHTLYIAYAADNAEHVHGILTLKPGWNHKYRIVQATRNPFPYTAGIFADTVTDENGTMLALLGSGCREIYTVNLTYQVVWPDSEEPDFYQKTYPIDQTEFFWLLGETALAESFGRPKQLPVRVTVAEMQLLDRDGNDVTRQYEDTSVADDWGGSKGSEGTFGLYVLLGILALAGIAADRYFLWELWRH